MLRKELGEHLVSLGMVGAALELFEEIELWDSLIVCLTLLGKKQAAADTIRRRLEVDPTDPKLWCALGDALDLEEHFQKALEVSDGKNARAMRSLARRAALREDWTKAAEHWSAAMKINPLFPDGWFSAGYALLKADREDEALSAFVRCTQIDAENGQAWNNVAALNIRRGKFAAAHVALQEAVKQVATSWQTWENLAMVAAKIGRFQQSARALVKVMDLTGGREAPRRHVVHAGGAVQGGEVGRVWIGSGLAPARVRRGSRLKPRTPARSSRSSAASRTSSSKATRATTRSGRVWAAPFCREAATPATWRMISSTRSCRTTTTTRPMPTPPPPPRLRRLRTPTMSGRRC
jgi:Flp pilus assembly protein TadD